MFRGRFGVIAKVLVVGCLLVPVTGRSQEPVSLEQALAEARVANARLPLAVGAARIARTDVTEAQASRLPRLSLESGLAGGAPLAYTTSQGQVQLVGSDTLFAGGLRRANLAAARYRVSAADAGVRLTTKDVDLEVRLRFSEVLWAQQEIAFRQEGIDRLTSYLGQIQARRVAGQPVGGDILTTNVRVGTEQATLADAERALDEARLELNDLMGRDPTSPLVVAPLSEPALPTVATDSPWVAVPDLLQAAANSAAATAEVGVTRAERRPQVSAFANVGALPVLGHDAGTGVQTGAGLGAALGVSLSLSLWDGGVFRTRLERAQLLAQAAHDTEALVRREVRLSWEIAEAQRRRLYDQVTAWGRNVPNARDAYLQTASMYAGGTATALEVLDAYAAWIGANSAYADALLRYRQADANSIRWGTP